MRIFAILGGLMSLLLLTGCAGVNDGPQASDETIAAAAYRAPGPATLTLMTMVSNTSGAGGHTALLINGSQRVIFDPAGSFRNERVPRRADVLYGISPVVLAAYKSAHARSTYHVASQTIVVTPEQAETALRLAIARGSVGSSQCAASTSALLAQVPGLPDLGSSLFPKRLMENMAQVPGVVTEKYFENDEGTIVDGIAKVNL